MNLNTKTPIEERLALEALEQIIKEHELDEEAAHGEAEHLLLTVLESVGYVRLVRAYNKAAKNFYYA